MDTATQKKIGELFGKASAIAKNCGIGPGGFQGYNTCWRGGGSGSSGSAKPSGGAPSSGSTDDKKPPATQKPSGGGKNDKERMDAPKTTGALNMCFENARLEFLAQKKLGNDAKYVFGQVTGSISGSPKGASPLVFDHAWVEVDGKVIDPSQFRKDRGDIAGWLKGDRKLESAKDHWAHVEYNPKMTFTNKKALSKPLDDFPPRLHAAEILADS